MNTLYILIGLNTIAFVGLAIILLLRSRTTDSESHLQDLLEHVRKDVQEGRERDREHLQERIDQINKVLSSGITENSKAIHGHFKQFGDIVTQVTEKLTKLDETNKQVVNFSEQLEDLQRILKQPKGKGVLGEYWLETMLSHVLQPDQYKMQYKFPNGEIVDAVVYFQDKVIPIDAKFSSEKYQAIEKEKDADKKVALDEAFKKDLKIRIDETAKYIRPNDGTTDYAFMFIPAEGIYYDLLVQKVGAVEVNRVNLIKYAHDKRVLIVSPNTFFAFLQTVIEGMRAYKMQESIQDVLKRVELLGKHLSSYDSFMQKMGNNLGTTVSMYNQAYAEFKKVDKDVIKLTDGEVGGDIEPLSIEKPSAHIDQTIEKVTKKKLGTKL